MAAEQALKELLEVSDEVEAAVVFDRDGTVLAASVDDEAAADVASIAARMLSYADRLRAEPSVERVEAVTRDGGVFVVRAGDRAVVASTAPGALRGLVLHDLRACVRRSAKRPTEKTTA